MDLMVGLAGGALVIVGVLLGVWVAHGARLPRLRLPRRKAKLKAPSHPVVEVPGTGVTDLFDYLLKAMYGIHPTLRRQAHWAMDRDWLRYVKQIGGDDTDLVTGLTVFGIHVVVTDDGGFPHLEPDTRNPVGGSAVSPGHVLPPRGDEPPRSVPDLAAPPAAGTAGGKQMTP
jgi:hypothetical protein